MVEVFKTNVENKAIADSIVKCLSLQFPNSIINFDLEDCDKILRIENCSIETKEIIQTIKQKGFYCEALE